MYYYYDYYYYYNYYYYYFYFYFWRSVKECYAVGVVARIVHQE